MNLGIQVTITDKTKGPFSLFSLLKNGTATGVTVVPAAGYANIKPTCCYLSIQADPTNGGGKAFKGDSGVLADGTRQEKVLQAGDVDVMQRDRNSIGLQSIYVNVDTNTTTKLNIGVDYC